MPRAQRLESQRLCRAALTVTGPDAQNGQDPCSFITSRHTWEPKKAGESSDLKYSPASRCGCAHRACTLHMKLRERATLEFGSLQPPLRLPLVCSLAHADAHSHDMSLDAPRRRGASRVRSLDPPARVRRPPHAQAFSRWSLLFAAVLQKKLAQPHAYTDRHKDSQHMRQRLT